MKHGEADFDKRLLEEDAQELYEHAPCAYISTLPDGTIAKVNAAFLAWTGYTREQILWKKRFQHLLPVAGRIYHDTHYGPLLQMQGYVKELAFDVLRSDGTYLHVLLNSTLKRDRNGNPLIIRTTLLDAQARRAYEQELLMAKRRAEEAEASVRRLNDTLEEKVAARTAERDRLWRTAQDLLAVASRNGHFLTCNPALTAILGWTENEIKAMPFSELVHPDDFQRSRAALGRLAAGESISRMIVRHRHQDGSDRWLSWNIVPEGDLLYFVGRDVSEEKRQAEVLRQTEDALRQAHKMEAVGQLTGGLAHDFNNLLAGMVGNLQMMRIRINQGRATEALRHVDAAEAVAGKATALTHRMLAFARRQTLAPEIIDVNQLIESMEDLFRHTIGGNVTIRTALSGDLRQTLSDRNQLESALLNLVVNARDAMPHGGRLTIATANSAPDAVGENASSARGGYVTISVTDTGTGMSPDVASRAFDPFFTTKPIGQGTGLGLSMIFGFIKQSGGHVRIHSALGEGTTVALHLPAYAGDMPGEQVRQDKMATAPADADATVLLVDDEAPLRILLAEVLVEAGYTVVQAENGQQAIEVLQSPRHIDLLVSDVGLPDGINGRELADEGRALRPQLKVILITGYVQDAGVRNTLSGPDMHVLNKPFALDVFIDEVSKALAGK
jgi:PAS domain S-box-containing protein